MKAINEDKLMYKFCYKCPCGEEVQQTLENRKPLAKLFKKIEKALRVARLDMNKEVLTLTYKEVDQLERYILALEIVEENAISKLNRIEEIL